MSSFLPRAYYDARFPLCLHFLFSTPEFNALEVVKGSDFLSD